MPFTNFNPPLTNKNLQDFFEFKCENHHKVLFLQNWIENNIKLLLKVFIYTMQPRIV
jgi:hypothetical protein